MPASPPISHDEMRRWLRKEAGRKADIFPKLIRQGKVSVEQAVREQAVLQALLRLVDEHQEFQGSP